MEVQLPTGWMTFGKEILVGWFVFGVTVGQMKSRMCAEIHSCLTGRLVCTN